MLPEGIEIPPFDGDLKNWVSFRDKFTEMVVKNKVMPNIYKMHHLEKALKRDAASLLSEAASDGENFTACWKNVLEFYDNPRVLITNLFSKLFSLEAMEKMTAKEIFRIKNSTNNFLRFLKLLGSLVDHWDDIIIFLTVGKLSSQIQRR